MRMGDFFSDNLHLDFVRAGSFLQCSRYFLYDFEILADIDDIPHPAMMLFRNDERVPGRERADIEKSEEVIIFVDLVCRYRTGNYLAENAVVHRDNNNSRRGR